MRRKVLHYEHAIIDLNYKIDIMLRLYIYDTWFSIFYRHYECLLLL